jgi:hypothetical protein
LDVFEKSVAVITDTVRVESDFRIGGVHDAVCADLVRARTHVVIVLGNSPFSLHFVLRKFANARLDYHLFFRQNRFAPFVGSGYAG